VRDEQLKMSELITKKTRATKAAGTRTRDDLLKEYRFDYSKARPNRFAARAKRGYRTILLDPDIAAVFTTAESVNAALRALIAVMPSKRAANKR
jgi:hypothetical protein